MESRGRPPSKRRYPTPPPYAIPRGPPTPPDVSTPEPPAERARRLRNESQRPLRVAPISTTTFYGLNRQSRVDCVAQTRITRDGYGYQRPSGAMNQSKEASAGIPCQVPRQDERNFVDANTVSEDSDDHSQEQTSFTRRDVGLIARDNTSTASQGQKQTLFAPSNLNDVHPTRRSLISTQISAQNVRESSGQEQPTDRSASIHETMDRAQDATTSGATAHAAHEENQDGQSTNEAQPRKWKRTRFDYLLYSMEPPALQRQSNPMHDENNGSMGDMDRRTRPSTRPFKKPTSFGVNHMPRKNNNKRYDFNPTRQCTPPSAPKRDSPLPLRSPSVLRQIVARRNASEKAWTGIQKSYAVPSSEVADFTSGLGSAHVENPSAAQEHLTRTAEDSASTCHQEQVSSAEVLNAKPSHISSRALAELSTQGNFPLIQTLSPASPQIKIEESVSNQSLGNLVPSSSTSSTTRSRAHQSALVMTSTSVEMENRRLRSIMKQTGFPDWSIDHMLDQAATRTWKQVVADMVVELEGVWPREGPPQQSVFN